MIFPGKQTVRDLFNGHVAKLKSFISKYDSGHDKIDILKFNRVNSILLFIQELSERVDKLEYFIQQVDITDNHKKA